jgi:hypothetical protein
MQEELTLVFVRGAQSARLFFRYQLKECDTEGGHRNKMVLIRTKRVE